jgi:tetratricopeptide (TPR) repeat protein
MREMSGMSRISGISEMKVKYGFACVLLLLIVAFIGCGGAKVNTGIGIPELDVSQYNDPAYTAGWEKLKAGKPEEALKKFQESNAGDEKLYIGFGYAFLAQNKVSLAKQNFEKALAINPANWQAHYGLAAMYESVKDIYKAFQIYARLRTKYPENKWIKAKYEHIKTTETQKSLDKARQFKKENKIEKYIAALKEAAVYSPEMTDIEIEMADFYYSQGQYEQAIRHYENVAEAMQDVSHKKEILLKLADIYEKNLKYDSAIIIYNNLLEYEPGNKSFKDKISELKTRFYEEKLPAKFKNIFFKEDVTREDAAALIGYYFDKYLDARPPIIITDIGNSFARDQIIKICTLGIMKIRPDHSFDRLLVIDRAAFAVIINNLVKYLEEEKGYSIKLTPAEETIEPTDISPMHKDYGIIRFMANAQMIKLDNEKRFNPTLKVTTAEVLGTIKKLLNSIEEEN